MKFHDGTDVDCARSSTTTTAGSTCPQNYSKLEYAYYFGAVFGGFGAEANIASARPMARHES